MVWQILELQKRFVNKNYILSEIVSIMCVLYHFHVENMQNCPLNTDVSMNWIRGYYALVYQPYENLITEDMFMKIFAQVAAGQNIAQKGIIPKMTIFEFMEQVRAEPYKNDINDEIRGSTPAGYVPPITDPNWPVEVTEYTTMVEGMVNVDSDTNFSRYGGMKRVLGIPITDKDYDIHYDGSDGKTPDNVDMLKEAYDKAGVDYSKLAEYHCEQVQDDLSTDGCCGCNEGFAELRACEGCSEGCNPLPELKSEVLCGTSGATPATSNVGSTVCTGTTPTPVEIKSTDAHNKFVKYKPDMGE